MRAGSSSWPDGPAALQQRSEQLGGGHGLRIQAGTAYPAADDRPDPELAHLARRAGREPARIAAHDSPHLLHPTTREGRFSFSNRNDLDHTRHRPPHPARRLPAAARARRARRSCSSRSTRAGSAATRSSAAATASSRSRRPSALGEPVVGYLGYDHIAKLEPTVPLPAAGPDVPESRFVVADTFLRFDHVTGTAEVLHGDPARVAAALARASPIPAADGPAPSTPRRERFPDRAEHERRVAPRAGAHPPRRRLPGRALAAGRAGDRRPARSPSTARCAASTRRRTSSCSSSASSRSSARRPRRTSRSRAAARA